MSGPVGEWTNAHRNVGGTEHKLGEYEYIPAPDEPVADSTTDPELDLDFTLDPEVEELLDDDTSEEE